LNHFLRFADPLAETGEIGFGQEFPLGLLFPRARKKTQAGFSNEEKTGPPMDKIASGIATTILPDKAK